MKIVTEETVIVEQSWNIKGGGPELLHENWLWNPALWSGVLLEGSYRPAERDDLDCEWPEAFQATALEFINDRLPEGFTIHASGTMTFSHYSFVWIDQARALQIADSAQWEAEFLDELFDVLAELVRSIKRTTKQ